MSYTIAVIEGVQTGRKAEIWASGKWRVIWIEQEGERYHTGNLDRDRAEEVFYRICRYVTECLYSYEDIVEMLKSEEGR